MAYKNNIFINCPFDNDYFPLLKPLIFTAIFCKLNPKISQTVNSDDTRITEIKNLINDSRYSIHDLSRIEPRAENELPRFNMPFELGIDVGCKTYSKKDKKYLILEKNPYRYKKVLSDISGQDIKFHNNEPYKIVKAVRDWFKAIFPRRKIPSAKLVWDAYNEFLYDFEQQMTSEDMDPKNIWEIPFNELIEIKKAWIKNYV